MASTVSLLRQLHQTDLNEGHVSSSAAIELLHHLPTPGNVLKQLLQQRELGPCG